MPTQRLFLAIALPVALRTLLAELAAPLPHVRWTSPDQLHVTLRFLGDIDTSKIDSLLGRLTAVQVEPFLLPIEGVGAFPPKRPPRVLWTGIGNGHPRLYQLRKQVDDAILAAGVDFDVRPFHPHVTLARCTHQAAPGANRWLRAHQSFEGPPFKVDAFDLISSELDSVGARHHLLERFTIAPASSA